MDNLTKNSMLGEYAVIKELTMNNWEVYTSTSGKSKYDIVAYHEKYGLKTFQVKTLLTKNNEVMLRSVRSNKKENKVKHFNKESQDILAVYSVQYDKVYFFISKNIDNKSTMRIDFEKSINICDLMDSQIDW